MIVETNRKNDLFVHLITIQNVDGLEKISYQVKKE